MTKKFEDNVLNKLEKLDERLDKVDTHLAVYNAELKIHIKSSNANGKRLIHVENHVVKVNMLMKILGAVALSLIGYIVSKYIGV